MEIKIPENLNTFLLVSSLSTLFIIFSIIYNTTYINYGFATFLYSYLAYFVNIFFVKGMGHKTDGERKPEFIVHVLLLIFWVASLAVLSNQV